MGNNSVTFDPELGEINASYSTTKVIDDNTLSLAKLKILIFLRLLFNRTQEMVSSSVKKRWD